MIKKFLYYKFDLSFNFQSEIIFTYIRIVMCIGSLYLCAEFGREKRRIGILTYWKTPQLHGT